MDNIRKTLERAEMDAPLSKRELAILGDGLIDQIDDNTYSRIIELGKYGAKHYRASIEYFLDYSDDPWLAKAALQTVCLYWGERNKYRKYILQFIQGVDWDSDEDCKLIAITEAGKLVRESQDIELLREILRIFHDENEDSINRECAYSALGIAMGRRRKDLPSAIEPLDFESQVDDTIIREAKAMATKDL